MIETAIAFLAFAALIIVWAFAPTQPASEAVVAVKPREAMA